MRLPAVLGVTALALSAAAIAQVGSTPVEQKTPAPGATPDEEAAANDSADGPSLNNAADEAVANDAAALGNTAVGDPVEASSKPPKN